jgi:hypothetical protein
MARMIGRGQRQQHSPVWSPSASCRGPHCGWASVQIQDPMGRLVVSARHLPLGTIGGLGLHTRLMRMPPFSVCPAALSTT